MSLFAMALREAIIFYCIERYTRGEADLQMSNTTNHGQVNPLNNPPNNWFKDACKYTTARTSDLLFCELYHSRLQTQIKFGPS